VRVFYAPPFLDMHNRMKEALAILGRIDRAVVRPPLQAVGELEQMQISEALCRSGLLASVTTG
jgi:4-hydroxy-tetrahydrodipicolinate synthase